MDERSLLLQIKENDSERAFNALFGSHYERLFRVAVYFLQNDDWAKEVTLDVFAELWEKRKTMTIPDDFRHFSFVMVRNAAMNFLKKEARHSFDASDADFFGLANNAVDFSETADSPETILEQSELFEIYNNLVLGLPERCRLVFCRVKEDGKSYAEVAAELQISVKTVDAQLQKAVKILRDGLEKYLRTENLRTTVFLSFFL